MQWCAGGAINKYIVRTLGIAEDLPFARVSQYTGRTTQMAQLTTILSRADERGVELLEAMGERMVRPDEAEALVGIGYGALNPDAPLPWEFIKTHVPREILRRVYNVVMRRVAEGSP